MCYRSKCVALITLLVMLFAGAAIGFATGSQEGQESRQSAASQTEGFEPLGPVSFTTISEYQRATGNSIRSFSEAPELAAMVSSREIPALSDRLPADPMVVQPTDSIGDYGGDIVQPSHQPSSFPGWKGKVQNLFRLSYAKGYVYVPNVAESFEFTSDYRTLTVGLRPGMRWSDGAPFTADDVLFWFEDILLNDELTPAKPGNLQAEGQLPLVKKVDDFTVTFTFAAPYPVIVDVFASLGQFPFAPAHYLKQFHADYNENASAEARADGYSSWADWFAYYADNLATGQNPELPTVDPWMLDSVDTVGNQYFVRNPYYWKVDVAGNQLPYADTLTKMLVSDRNVIELNAMNGEFTTVGLYLTLENFSLYKDNEVRGNYTAMLANGLNSGCFAYSFNLTHPDPALREIFNDIRFRRAMSLAINREEINQTFYFGLATPHQATVNYDSAFYRDWMGSYYTEYDPAEANRLLDEMGLTRGPDGIRIGPDGEPFSIIIEDSISVWGGPKVGVDQLLAEWWNAIGIKTATNTISVSLYFERAGTNEVAIPNWAFEAYDVSAHSNPSGFTPPFTGFGSGVEWATWNSSAGARGAEPPDEFKELFDLANEFKTTLVGTEEYLNIGTELVTKYSEGLYTIGTVAMTRWPMLRVNNLRNYLQGDPPWGPAYGHWGLFEMDQWFFAD